MLDGFHIFWLHYWLLTCQLICNKNSHLLTWVKRWPVSSDCNNQSEDAETTKNSIPSVVLKVLYLIRKRKMQLQLLFFSFKTYHWDSVSNRPQFHNTGMAIPGHFV